MCVSSAGVYKAAEARLLLLMYKVNYVSQGTQPKETAVTPAKIIEDSWTMDGFVSRAVTSESHFAHNRSLTLASSLPPPPLQVSAEPDGSSYVFQGFIQGKDYGQFGLQRLGKSRASQAAFQINRRDGLLFSGSLI